MRPLTAAVSSWPFWYLRRKSTSNPVREGKTIAPALPLLYEFSSHCLAPTPGELLSHRHTISCKVAWSESWRAPQVKMISVTKGVNVPGDPLKRSSGRNASPALYPGTWPELSLGFSGGDMRCVARSFSISSSLLSMAIP